MNIYQFPNYRLDDLTLHKLNESHFTKIFETMKDRLIKEVEKHNPKTRYDVQGCCMAIMNEEILDIEFNPFKKYLTENGQNWKDFLIPASVLLKNYYLEKHSEITN